MKICAISDMHGHLPEISECDVLCIAGDIVDISVQRDEEESRKWWENDFYTWAASLSCDKIIVTPGNHDLLLEDIYYKVQSELCLPDKVKILIDELYEYKGVTFYGTPWIAPIHWQTWAFEDIQHEYDEYVCPYEKIPKCDILITHENPNYNEKLEHCCFGKYKHHFFGHWHDGISYGHLSQYNCSILTDSYMTRERLKIVTVEIDNSQLTEQTFLDKIITDFDKLYTEKLPELYWHDKDEPYEEFLNFLKSYKQAA